MAPAIAHDVPPFTDFASIIHDTPLVRPREACRTNIGGFPERRALITPGRLPGHHRKNLYSRIAANLGYVTEVQIHREVDRRTGAVPTISLRAYSFGEGPVIKPETRRQIIEHLEDVLGAFLQAFAWRFDNAADGAWTASERWPKVRGTRQVSIRRVAGEV